MDALHLNDLSSPQALSIEEVERIMEETQDAIEYQKVCPFITYSTSTSYCCPSAVTFLFSESCSVNKSVLSSTHYYRRT